MMEFLKKGYKVAGLAYDAAGKDPVETKGGYYSPYEVLVGDFDEDFTLYILWEENSDLQIDSGLNIYELISGQNQKLNCIAFGDGLKYQWQISMTGGAIYENIDGANTNTLTVSSQDIINTGLSSAMYRCKVTDSVGRSKTGRVHTVNVRYGFLKEPTDWYGQAGQTAVFSVTPCEGYTSIEWCGDVDGTPVDLSMYSGITGIYEKTLQIPYAAASSLPEGTSVYCIMTAGDSDSYSGKCKIYYDAPAADRISLTIPQPINGKAVAESMRLVTNASDFRAAKECEWYLVGDELDETSSGTDWYKYINKSAGSSFDDGWYLAVVDLYNHSGKYIIPGQTKLVVNGKEISGDHIVEYDPDESLCKVAIPFYVVGDLKAAVITLPYDSVEYTGSAFTPETTVKLKNRTLTKDVDYKISYTDNTNAGIAKVIISGMNEINGKVEKTFVIRPVNLSGAILSLTGEFTFNRKEHSPQPVVKIADKTLTKDKDYILRYQNNINAGSATVIAEGIGNYTGNQSASFTIAPTGLKDEDIMVPDQIYTGDDLTPSATITSDGAVLTEGKDYTASYKNNRYAGIATVTITGQGNYSGTITRKFSIAKATKTITAESFEMDTNLKKKQTLSIKATTIGGKMSYSSDKKEVQVSKNGKIMIGKGFIGKAVISIVSDATENCEKCVKKITVTVKPLSVKLKKVKQSSKGKITVSWKKSDKKNASGYQIQYADNDAFKKARNVKVKGVGKTSKTVGKLLKGKTYYVRIRTWKKVGGKTFYSDWSKEKTVSITK